MMAFDPFLDMFCYMQRFGPIDEVVGTSLPTWEVRLPYGHVLRLIVDYPHSAIRAWVTACGTHRGMGLTIFDEPSLHRLELCVSNLCAEHRSELDISEVR